MGGLLAIFPTCPSGEGLHINQFFVEAVGGHELVVLSALI